MKTVLRLDGVIACDAEITPAQVQSALESAKGADITIWLNSPGGDCVAASRIYTMLMDYKGNVTIKIDGIAYSAASVVAMAGTQILMSPTALMMVHNPWSLAIGDSTEMKIASAMLDEVKEAIINAYQIRTGISRPQLSEMMDNETFMHAHEAIQLGFADGLLFENTAHRETVKVNSHNFSFAALHKRLVAVAQNF